MTNRYIHMLSWGLLYGFFSLFIVLVYYTLDSKKLRVKVKLSSSIDNKIASFPLSDAVIYLIIASVSAFRLNTGSDYYNYYMYYNNIKSVYSSPKEIISNSQFGYFLLSWIIKSITDNEYAIFIVIAFFSYFCLFRILRKEKIKDMSCALLCYMFLGFYACSNNILKQYIAMIFLMCAYLSFINKLYIRAIIYSLICVSFHYSSIFILFIILIVRNIKPTFYKYTLSIVGGITTGLMLNTALRLLTTFVPSAQGYSKYIDWRRNNQFRLVAAVFAMFLVYAVLIFFIIKHKNSIKQENQNRYNEIILLIVGLGINAIALRLWIISRIAIYFYQFIILILPTMFSVINNKSKKINLKLFLYTIMFLYMIFSSIFLGENEYFSYNTIFSGDHVLSDIEYNALHGWYKK